MTEASTVVGTFTRHFLIALALGLLAVVGLYLFWQVTRVLLVLFAGVLLAVLIDGVGRQIRRFAPIPRELALVIIIGLFVAITGLFVWLMGPPLAQQLVDLADRLPQSLDRLRERLLDIQWIDRFLPQGWQSDQFLSIDQESMQRAMGVFSSALGVLTNVFVIVVVGIFLATSPDGYITSSVQLAPPAKRERARAVLTASGRALRHWLAGRFAAMTLVGAMTMLGLWLIGSPAPLSLGFIMAVFSFVPYVGPILAFVPALLVALLEGPTHTLYVSALYLGINMIDGYVTTPLIQRRAVQIPPAFLIAVQALGGVLAGMIGLLLAAPLAVVVAVTVQMLYVEDVLGDRPHVLGND